MLRYCLILAFCGLSLTSLKSQSTIISFQPDDKGFGIGYRTEKMYASVSHGEYNLPIGNLEHSKLAFGGVLCPKYSTYSGQSFVTIGLCLHSYNKQSPQEFQRIVTYPISLELGAGSSLDRLSIGFRFDIIKNTSSIDIGIKF